MWRIPGVGRIGAAPRHAALWRVPWRVPWRLSVAEDGEGAIIYLLIIAFVVAAVIAAIMAVMSIGVFVLAAVAIAGGVWGLIMAIYNFFGVLVEAHKTVK